MLNSGTKQLIRIVGVLAAAVVFTFGMLATMSSRPNHLGVTLGRFAACPESPNCVSTQAEDAGHRIEPIALVGSSADAIREIKAVVAKLPRMSIVRETDDYLHVEATSRLFRFVDDVEFFIDAEARLIHFRSASRVGYSDLGANRKRMEQIRDVLIAKPSK